MRPGRHGGMTSGELELIIARNANFLSVRRAGSGSGQAGLYNSVTGEYIAGIGGGWLPEYSRHLGPNKTYLVRGWRNILYELLARGRISSSKEIKKTLGPTEAFQAREYGMVTAPMSDPAPPWVYSGIRSK